MRSDIRLVWTIVTETKTGNVSQSCLLTLSITTLPTEVSSRTAATSTRHADITFQLVRHQHRRQNRHRRRHFARIIITTVGGGKTAAVTIVMNRRTLAGPRDVKAVLKPASGGFVQKVAVLLSSIF